jgi:hypothetical protein
MFERRLKTRLAAVLVALFAAAGLAEAQILTGTVTGTVKDAQGGVIPGATVVIVSDSRGTKSTPVVTNGTGDFVVPSVVADSYTVEVTMPSFKTLQRSGIRVSAGERVSVGTLTIEVGGASETVEVKGETPQVQAASGERSFAASAVQAENLPLSGRSFTALVQFTPGVSGTSRLGGGGDSNTMMDGVSTMDTGNNAALLQLNVEAIAEVKVLTSNYQAEYGRSSGLQITAVTKSGTNKFRGSVYDVKRNSDWNSNSWENLANGTAKTVSRATDWGYTLGGPIGKPGGSNKLFFFFSQEWRPRTAGGNITRFRFPTAAERNGDFSQSTDNNGALYNLIRDASTGLPCSSNVVGSANAAGCFQDGGIIGKIPASRLYPIGLNILKMYPMPNCPDACTNLTATSSFNYQTTVPVISYLNNQPAIRFDYQPITALRATVKYAGERQRKQTFPGSLPGFNDTRMHDPVVTTIANNVSYNMNSSTFFEVNYGYARNAVAGCVNIFSNCTSSIPMSPASDKRTSGLGDLPLIFADSQKMDPRYYEYEQLTKLNTPMFQNGTILLPPTFNWGGRVGSAPPNIGYPGFLNYNLTQDLSISMTKVTGHHTVKTGFYNNHSRKAQNRGGGGPGSLSFANSTTNPLDTTFGFANAATGVFSTYTQLSRFMEGSYVSNNTEAYIQDNWKFNRKLTIDAGVRFVRQQPQYDGLGQSSNFLPDKYDPSKAPALYNAGCTITVAPGTACPSANRQAVNPLNNQFMGAGSNILIGTLVPNTGNAMNGIFKAGEGIVYTAYTWPLIAAAPRVGLAYDVSGKQSFVLRGGGGLFFDRPNGNSIYGLVANPPNAYSVTANNGLLQQLNSSGLAVQGAPALTTYEYDAKLPSSAQFNFGVQMALPWSSSFDVEYVAQHGFNLGQTINLNVIDLGSAFLAKNQDPTLASTTPGANAVANDLMRGYKGYGTINQFTQFGFNTYHSIQTSFSRRFAKGFSGQLNYTLGLSQHANAGARLEHDANGNVRLRADQDQANDLLGQADLRRHVFKGNFVWDLPDLKSSNVVLKNVGLVVNDWQLSGVFTGGSGARYSIGYSYQNGGQAVNITGSPDFNGRVVITGDPGSGCSSDQYKQFNTAAFAGPPVGSVGLESGQNYMIGCADHRWDFAIARNIRLPHGRNIQLRGDLFNAFNTVIWDGRNTTMNLQSPTDQTITNPQFNPDGTVVSTRLRPTNAGFGAVNGAMAMRSVQLQFRFMF